MEVTFIPQFTIFKSGRTNGIETIGKRIDDVSFDVSAKMEFYKNLGYTVEAL